MIERFGFPKKTRLFNGCSFSISARRSAGLCARPHHGDNFVLPDLGHDRCAGSNW
jgi:hypothetical protein